MSRRAVEVVGWLLTVVLAPVVVAGGGGLSAPWTYWPVNQPVLVDVLKHEGSETLRLVLMDADGDLHADPVEVRPGRVDLAERVPHLDRLRRAAFLQLYADDEPLGSALVLQPMLSRLVPVTEEAINPNGIRYTRIVGWQDEMKPPDADTDADTDTDTGFARPEDPWLANQPPDDRLFSGLRIYRERDVVLHTSRGEIRLAMRPDEAPNTVWNFLQLCRGGFYRGIPFHRIVPMTRDGDPFVIQAGDPTPTGSGGPGYWLPMERSRLAHDFGVISMARDVDPDSAGSQIFICLSRAGTARLDGHYCSFGVAMDGTETILDIADAELADVAAGRPVDPPVILAAELVDAPPRRPGEGRPDRPVRRAPPRPATEPTRVPR
ncbi:MAG: peptidylprolyl isomerase [Planctomycetes bacterium]|nr:peptidylprolyl isomerase [Planctomycetota bacterium]